jgi:hypothetical protein
MSPLLNESSLAFTLERSSSPDDSLAVSLFRSVPHSVGGGIVSKLAAAAAKVSREFALLEIQWCSATAGLLCGIAGLTSRATP